MNSLTIQILVLLASFLFYRVLRSGFDSWTAVLVDFGAVVFLFGLQYFLQKKKTPFPSGEISRLYGVALPEKVSIDENDSPQIQNRMIYSLNPKDNIYFEQNQKMTLPLIGTESFGTSVSDVEIQKTGYYLLQCSIHCDQSNYHAKLSLVGNQNQIDKSVHHGENSFVMKLTGPDKINFELENGLNPTMILDQSTIYLVEL